MLDYNFSKIFRRIRVVIVGVYTENLSQEQEFRQRHQATTEQKVHQLAEAT